MLPSYFSLQIRLETYMKFGVTNLYYSTKVCRVAQMMVSSYIRLGDAIVHMIIVICNVVQIMFVFDDHIVH